MTCPVIGALPASSSALVHVTATLTFVALAGATLGCNATVGRSTGRGTRTRSFTTSLASLLSVSAAFGNPFAFSVSMESTTLARTLIGNFVNTPNCVSSLVSLKAAPPRL
jgi:hypothetical protein